MGRLVFILFAGLLIAAWMPPAADGAPGDLSQPTGAVGCIQPKGVDADGNPCLAFPQPVGPYAQTQAVPSPDGHNLYLPSPPTRAIIKVDTNFFSGAPSFPPGVTPCIADALTPCSVGRLGEVNTLTVVGNRIYATRGGNYVGIVGRFVFPQNPIGFLFQDTGKKGCLSQTGSGGTCIKGKALKGATAVAESGDGKFVYVASQKSDAIAVFRRTSSGLQQLSGDDGCVSRTGNDCAKGFGLDAPTSLALSDGRLYVGAKAGIAVFRANSVNGTLKQVEGRGIFVSIRPGVSLRRATSLVASPDERNLYAVAGDHALAFRIQSGADQLPLEEVAGVSGCVSRTGTDGHCLRGRGLDRPTSIALSRDGKSAYVASDGNSQNDGVLIFRRLTSDGPRGRFSPPSGAAGCITRTGTGGDCMQGRGLSGNIQHVSVHRSDKAVYVAASNAVAVFAREAP